MAPATETRLLLLGSLLAFEPVNAYQLRRELVTWRIDEWAHVNPGSIYSGLATLARQGDVTRHDLVDNGREVAVYTTTEQGRAEFERLFADAMTTLDQSSMLGLYTALTSMPVVERGRMIELFQARVRRLEGLTASGNSLQGIPEELFPPNVPFINRLWTRFADCELEWARDALARIQAGEGSFKGEPLHYRRAPDDPGNQIQREAARYRALLGLA